MPDDPRPHRGLAYYYKHKGDFQKAIISFEVALELEPGNVEDWRVLAELYTATGQKEKAEEILHDVVYEQVEAGSLVLDLAKAEEEKGNIKGAERLYEKAWRQKLSAKEKFFCGEQLGRLRASKGSFREALRYFEGIEHKNLTQEGLFGMREAL